REKPACELGQCRESRRVLFRSLAASASEIGRSFLAPPGLAPERAAALRAAFARMVADPEFVAESARRGLEVEPLAPEALLQIVEIGRASCRERGWKVGVAGGGE